MAGGVYCPLSPQDPQHRLHALTKQTQSRLVLIHWLTKMKFNNDILLIDIQSILFHNDLKNEVNVDRLTGIIVIPNNIAYIIFTSGSTGTPKEVCWRLMFRYLFHFYIFIQVLVRHGNFIECMCSLVSVNEFTKDDTAVQMSRCSFDIHIQEILGILLYGATVVMLHPGGTIDFEYLSQVLEKKQITCMGTVPTLLNSFFTFLEQHGTRNPLKYLRSLWCGGK